MKKSFFILVFILTIVCGLKTPAQAASTIVPDDNLRLAINEVIGQASTHEPTTEEIATIDSLNISGKNISSLEGLQYATSLKELFTNHNEIADFNPISDLTQLEILELSSTKITDTKQLSKLINLRILTLGTNNLTEIEGVKDMTKLESIFAADNSISDLSPLTNCTSLTSVNFINNEITDVTVFAGLDNIITGRFAYNHISNISSFKHDIPQAGNLNFDYQTITLPAQPVSIASKNLTMPDPIIGAAGQPVTVKNITNNGVYANKEISWNNLTTNTKQTTYDFDHFFTYNQYYMNFSGTVTQPITWYSDTAPVIHGEDVVIDQYSEFTPKDYVTADDVEDGDLTKKIVITENNVNTSIPGTYTFTSSVTDSDGNTTQKTIKVTVRTKQQNPTTNNDKTTPNSRQEIPTNLVINNPTSNTSNHTDKSLPKTGENDSTNSIVLGVTLALTGILLCRRKN
ncbi:leucine-rich repeat domain-containing protein [Listeria seeligeri]|uniref:leucine-rich repeat domain-containing protein n=1 Tax=Listeria seeligeri TaxID=1640 RepID=UPI0018898D82|nr:leucine-rich repeat domain-containing protein [Listeria seeligeri]MBF2662485.1 DUF5011 domain-containing protein [Listeria seeligeri]